MRIVVIGGTRFMGPHVIRALANTGHEVVVFHRGKGPCVIPSRVDGEESPGTVGARGEGIPRSARDDMHVRHIHGDRMQLPRELHGDVAIDMWCMTEAHARVAKDHFRHERIVVISSADVYRQYDGLRGRYDGPPDRTPLTEDALLRENLYPYGGDYEKILVERTLAGPRTTILRLPAVYGPDDEQHRFANWIAQMDEGRNVIRIDERQAHWRWTRGYAENVAGAIVLAALNERAAGKTYNVGEPHAPTDEEWVRMIGDAAGWRGRIERGQNVEGTMPLNFEYDLATDTTAIRRDLEYVERIPRTVALASTVAWERRARAARL